MKKFSIFLVVFAMLSALFLKPVAAQTDLMQDVDAVKENNADDLYTPDDEASNSSAATPPAGASKRAAPAAPNKTANTLPSPGGTLPPPSSLDDLPVDAGSKPNLSFVGSDTGDAAELTSIRIYPLGDRTRYEIQTSKVADYAPESVPANKQFIINFANTTLGPLVAKAPINAENYPGPVRQVQVVENKTLSGNSARVVMQLDSVTEPTIRREGNRLLVDFYTAMAPIAKTTRNGPRTELPDFETLMSLNGKENFVGTKVNFKTKDANVPDVLQFLSQVSGKNFVLAGETDKKISMNVKNVPWDQVLALVLLNADLGYQKEGNTYRVMPVIKIRQEIADSIKAQDDQDKLAPKATQLFPLSYAKTSEVVTQITKFLKPEYNETVVSDDRTNSIVVTALPKNIQRIRRYMEAIDKQTPVIQIEARIVQASKDFSREIGINWSALGQFKIANGVLNIGTALGQASASSAAPGVVSNGKALGGTGGSFGSYSNTAGATLQNLDTVLKFNESKNGTRELSRPSLTVLNNKKATIIDGTEYTFLIPGQTGTADTSSTKSVKATLSLTVTPQVTNDNNIILNIDLTRDSLGAAPNSTIANIPIDKREISTETLIESGATAVIGGVYIKEDHTSEAGWPFFRNLPIFGKLFTSDDSKFQSERELLMFISPRVLNLEKASVYQQSLEEAR